MFISEEEARKKWCPLARAPGGMIIPDNGQDKRIGVTQNRGYQMGGALSNCMCIGSACMAWRPVNEWRVRSDYPWERGVPHGDRAGPNNETRVRGYCGAFGKVES